MSKDKKPTDRSDLLDELNSIQSLLGDAARDVHQEHMEDDIPMLPPETDAARTEGDAHTQIPLLGEDAAGKKAKQAPLHKALTERANPFLSQTPPPPPARPGAAPATRAIEEMIAQRAERANPFLPRKPSSPGEAAAAPSAPTLSDAQLRALVDEILAQWMPRIERELRDRLMDELRNPSKR